MKDLVPQIIDLAHPIVLAALSWLAVWAAKLIAAKTKNEYLAGVLHRTTDAAIAAVKEIEQTYVSAIRAGKADGKLTDDEKTKAREAAMASLKSHLGTRGLGELAKVLGGGDGLDKYLGTRMEAALHTIKAAAPSHP